jgi:hypothetical protein
MPSVLRKDGFDFRIYPLDHPPAHVHVFKSGEAIINVGWNESPSVREIKGMAKRDVRHAIDIVSDEQIYLWQRWCEFHADKDEHCQGNGEETDEETDQDS